MENAVIPNATNTYANDEEIGDDIIIYDADRLTSDMDPLQNKKTEIEGVDAENKGLDS